MQSISEQASEQTMRAVLLEREGAPDVLRVARVPRPSPGSGEVRVAIATASLNRLDAWIRIGQPAVPKPWIMGGDAAGIIDAVGSDVDPGLVGSRVLLDPAVTCGRCAQCLRGDSVFCADFSVLGEQISGTHAEFVVVPAVNCHPIPGHLNFQQAAALPMAHATAWRMLNTRAAVRPGETVLVWAATGGVGLAAIQLCAAMGVATIAVSRSADKLEICRANGATHTINTSDSDVIERCAAITGGAGVDVAFDNLGEAAWSPSLKALRVGGRYVTCGVTTGANPPAKLNRVFWRQLTILGSTMASKGDFADMLRFVSLHRIAPHIDAVLPLDEIAAAHERLETNSHAGKIVLAVSANQASA